MKKIPVAAFNLKFMRIPFLLCLFAFVIMSSVIISANTPPIHMGNDIPGILMYSCGIIKKDFNPTGVFSTLEKATTVTTPQPMPSVTAEKKEGHNDTTEEVLSKTLNTHTSAEVKVSNATDSPLDINEYLAGPPGFIDKGISVLVVHTHTTESYTPSEKYDYTPSDTDRTCDKNYNMVKVGEEVVRTLRKKGIDVIHDTTINDYPSYNGSYNRSSAIVSNAISDDPSIKIVLDIHRDAIQGAEGKKVKYTCDVNGKKAACIMLVAGSNLSGLSHDNWQTNLQFAATLQEHIQSIYPGLMRPINFRSQRFNQHLAPGAIIVEVGTNGNTLEEALLGAELFADSLSDYLNKYSNRN